MSNRDHRGTGKWPQCLYCACVPEHRALGRGSLGWRPQLLATRAASSVTAAGGPGEGPAALGDATSAEPPETHKANSSSCLQTTKAPFYGLGAHTQRRWWGACSPPLTSSCSFRILPAPSGTLSKRWKWQSMLNRQVFCRSGCFWTSSSGLISPRPTLGSVHSGCPGPRVRPGLSCPADVWPGLAPAPPRLSHRGQRQTPCRASHSLCGGSVGLN